MEACGAQVRFLFTLVEVKSSVYHASKRQYKFKSVLLASVIPMQNGKGQNLHDVLTEKHAGYLGNLPVNFKRPSK